MKEILTIWLVAFTLINAIWYLINKDNQIDKDFQIKCLEKWWVIELTPWRYSQMICNIKK